jgi:hypothetical protein
MTRVARYLAIAAVEMALLATAFGLGRAMTPPVVAVQTMQTVQTASSAVRPITPSCAVTGDLVGDANPADIARTLCGTAGR